MNPLINDIIYLLITHFKPCPAAPVSRVVKYEVTEVEITEITFAVCSQVEWP